MVDITGWKWMRNIGDNGELWLTMVQNIVNNACLVIENDAYVVILFG